MKKLRLSFTSKMLSECGLSVLAAVALTAVLWLIGRDELGEAVIAMLYLALIGWSASRWGRGAGLCTAVTAALMFDFFFIPPFYTFAVGRLEGWLVLVIFVSVAAILVERIQSVLSQARASERDAIFMYELSSALAGAHTQPAVADTVAKHLQCIFLARLVRVIVEPDEQLPLIVRSAPVGVAASGKPDLVIPIQAARGLAGEIHIWRSEMVMPLQDSRLLQNFATQTALALERTRLAEAETRQSLTTAVATR